MVRKLTRRQWLQGVASGVMITLTSCRAELPRPASTGVAEAITKEETMNEPTPTPTSPQPPPATQAPVTQPVPLAVKIGQLFMVGFRGLTVDENHPIVHDIVERHLGGVVLFDYDVPNGEFVRNIASPQQVQELTGALQRAAASSSTAPPLLIATDQEGGKVARLRERDGFPATVSHAALGKANDVAATFAQAEAMARTLAEAGINQNLAPVVDLNINPASPAIGAYERSFSADPQVVIAQARAFIEAHHTHNVLCTLKHFPGHGSAREDTHRGFVDVSATWSPVELEPYAALINAGLADAVMTAHVFNQAWSTSDPATLAPAAIQGLLREEMGYTGVVISDDMQMGAIREFYTFDEAIEKALTAGIDIIAIANNSIYDEQVLVKGIAVIERLLDEGKLTEARIEQSYQRVMELKARLKASV
ncbi:MAG: glycoside hydrolase family 3 N-terminal domain-containing protein [Caldilineaceae bacterium]